MVGFDFHVHARLVAFDSAWAARLLARLTLESSVQKEIPGRSEKPYTESGRSTLREMIGGGLRLLAPVDQKFRRRELACRKPNLVN